MRSLAAKLIIPFLVMGLFSAWINAAGASDKAREKYWEGKLARQIDSGEARWLKGEGQKFLGLYRKPAKGGNGYGVILVHGLDSYPDDKVVMKPLRGALATLGWHTLSIQMPALKVGAKPADYAPLMNEALHRIDAAVAFLSKQGLDKLALIGYDLGSAMSAAYMSRNPNPSVVAFVAIGAATGIFKGSDWDYEASVVNLKVPTLDICGSKDTPEVLGSTRAKTNARKKGKVKSFVHMQVNDANHEFSGKNGDLLRSIESWLGRSVKSSAQASKPPIEPASPGKVSPSSAATGDQKN